MSLLGGYRGYIGGRPVAGHRVPQHVQNLVVRDYAERHGLTYRLSAVEYVMPGSFLMLDDLMTELDRIDGIIAYSLFMLPPSAEERSKIWRRVLDSGSTFHTAVEEQVLARQEDIERLEMIFKVHGALEHAWKPESARSPGQGKHG